MCAKSIKNYVYEKVEIYMKIFSGFFFGQGHKVKSKNYSRNLRNINPVVNYKYLTIKSICTYQVHINILNYLGK